MDALVGRKRGLESNVDRVSERRAGGFVNGFGKGGMGVNRVFQFFAGGFESQSEAHFGDEFGGFGTDDMGAEQFSVFFAEEEFHKTLGFAGGLGLSTAGNTILNPPAQPFDSNSTH